MISDRQRRNYGVEELLESMKKVAGENPLNAKVVERLAADLELIIEPRKVAFEGYAYRGARDVAWYSTWEGQDVDRISTIDAMVDTFGAGQWAGRKYKVTVEEVL